MKGLCIKVLKHHALKERPDVADYPTYEVIAELSYPIEEGYHPQIKLNNLLELREVNAMLLDRETYRVNVDDQAFEQLKQGTPVDLSDVKANVFTRNVYSLTFDLDCQDDNEHEASMSDLLQATMFAQQNFPTVLSIVDELRDRIRAVVPATIDTHVQLVGKVIEVKIADAVYPLPLRIVYEDWILCSGMLFTWKQDDDQGLRMQYNLPPFEQASDWFVEHNTRISNLAHVWPAVAGCALVFRPLPSGEIEYVYITMLKDGGYSETKMRTSQILNLIRAETQPSVTVSYSEGQGMLLEVDIEPLLPDAVLALEHYTDKQLALTALL